MLRLAATAAQRLALLLLLFHPALLLELQLGLSIHLLLLLLLLPQLLVAVVVSSNCCQLLHPVPLSLCLVVQVVQQVPKLTRPCWQHLQQ
jgi:hypothetical protein